MNTQDNEQIAENEKPEVVNSNMVDTDRLLAFSDGIFAVAITLLILDIHVPPVADTVGHGGLAHALLAQWPSYFSYVLSFITVGITWINHHQMFRYITRTNHGPLVFNALLLMVLTFIPFPTALLAEYIQEPNEQKVAALTYGIIFTLSALAFNLVWWYAAYSGLTAEKLDPKLVRGMAIRYIPGPILYIIATASSLISATLAVVLYGAMAIFYLVPNSALGTQ